MPQINLLVALLVVTWIGSPALAGKESGASGRSGDWTLPLEAGAFEPMTDGLAESHAMDSRVIGLVTGQAGIDRADPVAAAHSDQGLDFVVRGRVTELRSMRWTRTLDEPTDGGHQYFMLSYKAKGIHRDYTKSPVLSVAGQNVSGERASVTLLDCTQVINDNRWHVVVGKADVGFGVTTVEVHVQTTDSLGDFAIGQLLLTKQLPIEDTKTPTVAPTPAAQNPGNAFKPIDISGQFNDSLPAMRDRVIEKHTIINDAAAVTGLPPEVPLKLVEGENNLVTAFEDHSANEKETEFLGHALPHKYFFPASRDDRTVVRADGRASEAYLLLAADLPPNTGRYGLSNTTFHIDDVEQVSIEVMYADGSKDLVFPYSLADEGFIIRRGLGAYVIPTDVHRSLKSITLNNRYYDATISLGAMTLNTSDRPVFPHIATEPELIRVPDAPDPSTKPPYLTVADGLVRAGNGYYELEVDCRDGFALRRFQNHWRTDAKLSLGPASGLRIEVGDRVFTGQDFMVTRVQSDGLSAVIQLRGKTEDNPLELSIGLEIDQTPEARMRMTVSNRSDSDIRPRIQFPYLNDMTIGDSGDTWMCFPKYRNVISNKVGYHFASNDHAFPMQFMDVYNPELGVGLAVITHNLDHMPLDYAMSKSDAGVTTFVQYPPDFYSIPAGQSLELVETALASHKGDWREAVFAYRRWVDSWYQPRRAVNDGWFKRVSLLKDYFLTDRISQRDLKMPSMFDRDTGRFRADEYLEMDRRYWGGIEPDMFHFFQWYELEDADPTQTQYGEMGYGNYGGLERFRSGLLTLQQKRATPVSLYTLPDRIGQGTEAGRRFGEDAVKKRADGSRLVNDLTWYVCSQQSDWRDYFVDSVKKVQAETGADAIYMDVVGFWRTNVCYASDHGHRVPSWYNQATQDIVQRIRESLPPDVVVWTEYPVTDVNSQWIDGNIAYYYLSLYELWARPYDSLEDAALYAEPSVNLYRFLFPDVKQIDLPIGNDRAANGPRRLKFIFFHGDGLYDNGWFQFEDRTRHELMIKSTRIKNQYRDCFYSPHVTPLVPTERGQVYANRFDGQGRTLWTLYNARFTMVRGPVLEVEHVTGATYHDAWNDRALTPTIRDGKAIISLTLDPQGLGCVVQRAPDVSTSEAGPDAPVETSIRPVETSMN